MTDGTCLLCGETYTKRGMTRHVRACLPDSRDVDGTPTTLLRITGEHRSDYWLHALVENEATLSTLDSFLRDLWLECCGHMSSFTIDGVEYVKPYQDNQGSTFGAPRRSMDIAIGGALDAVEECSYVYDFGSSTHLTVQVSQTDSWVVDDIVQRRERDGSVDDGILLVARNDAPERECANCGEQAAELCQSCLWERGPEAMFCESCARDHERECERPSFLPVVNSPRSGVCGYTG